MGCSPVKGTPDAAIDAAAMFTVGGTVTGFAGSGMVLRLNGGSDLAIAGDGAFSFPDALTNGTSYAVTVGAQPSCPQRLCALAGADGTLAGTNASVTVTCAVPRYRLASHNWGAPQGIRITDDVLALANNATSAPRIVTGASTGLSNSQIDSITFDRTKDLLYAPATTTTGAGTTAGILVFANASTTTGDVAPARRIVVAGETNFEGVELDEGADRLYASGVSGSLYVFNNASTLTGTVAPTATIALASPGAISLDRKTDRLYVAARAASLFVFDGARQLTSASTPTRTMTWTTPTDAAFSLAIDSCRNRLYLSFRNVTAGVNVFAFDNASTLTGAVDPQTASQARLTVPANQVMSTGIDSAGNLYFWRDSATSVNIINAPQSLSGMVTMTPDKVINAVVDRGYGLDIMAY
jgi:hypothetical protein